MKSSLSEEMKHLNLCEQIKQQIDLADYVRSCGIELTRHGKNDLKGLCPFHNDTNPSMIITPSKGLYHCPVCGKGGSIIDYASDFHNTNLKITIQELSKLLPSQTANTTAKKEKIISVDQPVPRSSESEGGCSSACPAKPLRSGVVKNSLSPERSAELLEKTVSFYPKSRIKRTLYPEKTKKARIITEIVLFFLAFLRVRIIFYVHVKKRSVGNG